MILGMVWLAAYKGGDRKCDPSVGDVREPWIRKVEETVASWAADSIQREALHTSDFWLRIFGTQRRASSWVSVVYRFGEQSLRGAEARQMSTDLSQILYQAIQVKLQYRLPNSQTSGSSDCLLANKKNSRPFRSSSLF